MAIVATDTPPVLLVPGKRRARERTPPAGAAGSVTLGDLVESGTLRLPVDLEATFKGKVLRARIIFTTYALREGTS